MKAPRLVPVFPLLASLALFSAADARQAAPEGFRALFNGRDLTGWWGAGTEDPRQWQALSPESLAAKKRDSLKDINDHWSVEDRVLINDGNGLYLTTDKDFGDFELLIEYKTVPRADSGIYLRGIPQVQIWDYTEEGGKWDIGADQGSGGLWNNSPGAAGKDPLVFADHAFERWNSFRIIMVGEYVTVWLNDQLVVDHARMENYFDRDQPLPRTGPIQLQTHGGEISWRNIFIREIPTAEANAMLLAREADSFAPLFNGKDLTGWRGPVENYEVREGAIVCKPRQGGTIFTEGQYSDFILRTEFKLPPGGNNGIAIRYPGSGDAAYVGMCELQVLDNTAAQYASLDPRQFHGSVYAQVAAKRGYLRPVGEWNVQETTVRGSRITVVLNGTRILDADVSEVTERMYDNDRFTGRERTTGHVGLCGHNDPVAFRQIMVKPLPQDTPHAPEER